MLGAVVFELADKISRPFRESGSTGKCPVIHTNNNNLQQEQQTQQSEPQACPVKSTRSLPEEGAKCPVNHGKGATTSVTATATAVAAAQGDGQQREEPKDLPDRPIKRFGDTPCRYAKVKKPSAEEEEDPHNIIPAIEIPATGRGNSEDGQTWLNPSANQLFRALRRKDKPIEHEDSLSVAAIHQMVTSESWRCVMEFEELHAEECDEPSLARFEGKDGIYSPKARFLNLFGLNLPFDRHDWVVDRCGKEVTYIIDYYSIGENDEIEYFIDARPAGAAGALDRLHLATKKILRGEKPW